MSSHFRFPAVWQSSRAWVAVGLVTALGAGTAYRQTRAVGEEEKPAVKQKQVHQAEQLSAAFRHAAEVAMPSTVTIRSKAKPHAIAHKEKGGNRPGRGNPFKGTPFEGMFPDGGPEGFGPQQTPGHEGMGTGVIVDKSGIVLTNNHVVKGADEVTVHLPDGREFKAEEIKTDEQSDLAVLRIRGAGTLTAASLGDSDDMQIGDWVLAVGNPFELEQTVSAGIISGKGRELGSVQRSKFLQTDAAINPGNSGGPLVNLEGEVIGINTAIASNTGAYQGIGFAIPSNQAKWVMNQLIKNGAVERAYLGVKIQDVQRGVAEKLGVKHGEGVLVAEVMPNSPAAAAGFKDGDVVTEFDGHKIHAPRDLQELVERVPVDSHQKVTVVRDGKSVRLDVVAKAMPGDVTGTERSAPAAEDSDSASDNFKSSMLGLEVTDVTAEDAESLGFKGHHGVLIAKVDPDGPAAAQGLRPGMLITKVDKKGVKSVAEFEAALKHESLKDGVLLWVRSKTGNQLVVVQDLQQ